jgi:phage FluMu protein Com
MSKKPEGVYERCDSCNKWLTLEQVDENYNEYKTPYCNECIKIVRLEEKAKELVGEHFDT